MKDEREENECTALVKVERAPLAVRGPEAEEALVPYDERPLSLRDKWRGYVERKREEFETAWRAGKVADPFTSAIAIGIYVSVGLSAASMLITRALMPKPPRQERGRMTGEVCGDYRPGPADVYED